MAHSYLPLVWNCCSVCLTDRSSYYTFHAQTFGHPAKVTPQKYQPHVLLSLELTHGAFPPWYSGFELGIFKLNARMLPLCHHPPSR